MTAADLHGAMRVHARGRKTLPMLAACATLAAIGPRPSISQEVDMDRTLTITTAEERGSTPGADDYFTGETTVSMLFTAAGARTFAGANVSFQPGARTAWHSHPAGQTLVVTEGQGWVQIEGQERRDLSPGDVVWIPPGVRHWHGATSSYAMTHLALQGEVDGEVVSWFAELYLNDPTEVEQPYVSPLLADLSSMPPALFTVGTADPLLDDSLFMHARWIAAGNRGELAIYPGGCHAFDAFPTALAVRARARMHAFLRSV